MIKLVNKKPKWNERRKAFQLDFPVKNMILVDAETEKKEALLIAKTDDN